MSQTTTAAPAPLQSSAPAAAPTQGSGAAPAAPPNTTPAAAPEAAAPVAAPEAPGNLLADAKPEAAPEAAAPEAPAEPVKYEFKLPEGVAADDPLLLAYAEAAGEAKLPADVAQAVMERLAPKLTEALQAPHRLWNETQATWQTEMKADAEFGGAKLAPTLASVARVLDDPRFGDPKVREALTMTGAGNNPAIIRTLARMAAALNEGAMVPGAKPAPAGKPTAAVMYPTLSEGA